MYFHVDSALFWNWLICHDNSGGAQGKICLIVLVIPFINNHALIKLIRTNLNLLFLIICYFFRLNVITPLFPIVQVCVSVQFGQCAAMCDLVTYVTLHGTWSVFTFSSSQAISFFKFNSELIFNFHYTTRKIFISM